MDGEPLRQLAKTFSQAAPSANLWNLVPDRREELPDAIGRFLDAACTATARGSHYRRKTEQEEASLLVHQRLLALSRGIYSAALLLPGVTHYFRQLGVEQLLSQKRSDSDGLTTQHEQHVLRTLCASLPPQRLIKLFEWLRAKRINNARTRKLILQHVIGASNLELWAVKYRRKLASALTHAWGKRTTSIVRSILAKPLEVRTQKERDILRVHIHGFVNGRALDAIHECLAFILGLEHPWSLPLLRAYREAKRDLAAGRCLPYEVLEGIRSRYHKGFDSDKVLEIAKEQLTKGQRMGLQRKAEEAGIEVCFDPMSYGAIRLYLYSLERGMTPSIREALRCKARETAQQLGARMGRIRILLDTSASMAGHPTQGRRPMAIALAIRDVLCAMADHATIVTTGSETSAPYELAESKGDTALAAPLVELLKAQPDAVFIISDGYENAPAGRLGEVVHAARRIGITTPICHFSPVFASEATGLRTLNETIPALPVGDPEAILVGFLKILIAVDLEKALGLLLASARHRIEASEHRRSQSSGPEWQAKAVDGITVIRRTAGLHPARRSHG